MKISERTIELFDGEWKLDQGEILAEMQEAGIKVAELAINNPVAFGIVFKAKMIAYVQDAIDNGIMIHPELNSDPSNPNPFGNNENMNKSFSAMFGGL